jgi:glutamate synthase (NADPH/NADH) small chain
VVVGKTVFDEDGFDAVFIATGVGLPVFLNIPGEHLNGVYSANEFLTASNLMHALRIPRYDEPMMEMRGRCVAAGRREHGA